eukprot:9057495-Pyramimonas_sp.AAC.1
MAKRGEIDFPLWLCVAGCRANLGPRLAREGGGPSFDRGSSGVLFAGHQREIFESDGGPRWGASQPRATWT